MLHLAVLHARKLCVYSVSGKRISFSCGVCHRLLWRTEWRWFGSKYRVFVRSFLSLLAFPTTHDCFMLIFLTHEPWYSYFYRGFLTISMLSGVVSRAACDQLQWFGLHQTLKLKLCSAVAVLAVEPECLKCPFLGKPQAFSHFSSSFLASCCLHSARPQDIWFEVNWVLFPDVVLWLQV